MRNNESSGHIANDRSFQKVEPKLVDGSPTAYRECLSIKLRDATNSRYYPKSRVMQQGRWGRVLPRPVHLARCSLGLQPQKPSIAAFCSVMALQLLTVALAAAIGVMR